jgi:hypothetical protein
MNDSVLLELHYGAKRGSLAKPEDRVILTEEEPEDWDVLYTFQPLSTTDFLKSIEPGVYEVLWRRILNVPHSVVTR